MVPGAGQHSILINGESVSLGGVPVQTTLLDFLRARGLTGAKEGCAEGECGACTVAMVTENSTSGSLYQAVNSCLMFVPGAIGREFYTVESLARDGELCEAQKAMAAAGGSQCGYCTPGFVMSLFAEQYRPGRQGPCNPHALGGNLCRCTGYRPIRDGVLSVGPAPAGPFRDRLAQPAQELVATQYTAHDVSFDRPTSLEECLSLAAKFPDAKLVSGCTDSAVESNLRFRRWPHLISVEGVAALRGFSETPEAVSIGAALPLSELERRWTSAPPVVHQWLEQFASLPIRNRATLGGNLATASPIGDSAPLLMALNASLHVKSVTRDRVVPLSGFFKGYRQTQLEEGEIICAIQIPKPFPAFLRFYKATKRRMDDISIVSAGFSIDCDSSGVVQRAAFVFGGVGAVTQRVLSAEQIAVGKVWEEALVTRIGRELEASLQPMDDHRGSSAYRLAVSKRFVEKFYWEWRQERT